MMPSAMVAMIQPNSDRVLMAGRTPTRSTSAPCAKPNADDGDHDPVIHAQAHQREADQRAQHQGFALTEVSVPDVAKVSWYPNAMTA